MATDQQVQTLQTTLQALSEALAKEMTSRSQWGEITFEAASVDLRRLKDVVSYMRTLPLDYIPEGTAPTIDAHLRAPLPTLKAIDAFSISTGNPPIPQRDSLVGQLHVQTEQLLASAGLWIPFLAYKQGDVAANIQKMATAADEGRRIIDAAKVDVEKKAAEISSIIASAREASASAGAAVFTADFENESAALETSASRWLAGSALLAAATLLTAVSFLWLARMGPTTTSAPLAPAAAAFANSVPAATIGPQAKSTPIPAVAIFAGPAGLSPTWEASTAQPSFLSASQVAQVIGAKLIILTVLLTAATWCGRNYKALRHLAVVNRHRALSLRTLRAFTAAASDDLTKNAVLLEATRAIFAAGATGYIEGKDGSDDGSSVKIVEIAKGLGARSSTG